MGKPVTRERGYAAIFAIGGFTLLLVVAAAFVFRKPILAYAVESYFGSGGAKANVEILRFDGTALTMRLSLGEHGEFSARAVEVRFDPHYTLPHIDRVAVSAPVVRMKLHGQSLSFGSLQPLVDTLKKPRARSWIDDYVRSPLPVSLDAAHVIVDTDLGQVEIAGTARVAGAQILKADLRVVPTTLRAQAGWLRIEGGAVKGAWNGAGFDAEGNFAADGASKDAAGLDAPFRLRATFRESGFAWKSAAGASSLAIPSFTVDADIQGLSSATHVAARGDLNWQSGGGLSSNVALDGRGNVGAANVKNALRLLPVLGSEPTLIDAFSRSAQAIGFHANLRLAGTPDRLAVIAGNPIAIKSDSGASLALAQVAPDRPLLTLGATVTGGIALKMSGGGLPAAELTVANFAFTNTVAAGRTIDATLQTTLSVSTTAFQSAAISGRAHLTEKNKSLALVLDGCANVRLGALVLNGKKDVSDARAVLCADPRQSLFASDEAGWRFGARFTHAIANLPAAQAAMTNATGLIAMTGASNGRTTGTATLSRGVLADLLKGTRFLPIAISGTAALSEGTWRGRGTLESTRHPTKLGTVTFWHRLADAQGQATINAHGVRFVPGGFAPSDLSPLLASIARADGTASFGGQIAWNRRAITSGGHLDVDGLQFTSPLGGAQNTTTHIKFISLLPPETAPDQGIGIDRIEWVSPLTAVGAHFHFSTKVIDLSGMTAEVAGGTVRIDPLSITVGANQTISGTVRLSQIDLGQLLEQSNLSSKVHAQALLSGTIPFSISNEGFRVKDGYVAATKPGRISIDRTLWTSGAISSNAMQEFAYQAMENLAFDTLQGKINSLPGGRLGLILHINGRNDPPKAAEARVGLFDLLRGQAFSKPVPLPKGTPIDLTLDTSLNFDELLRAYRAARSPEVVNAGE
jgi:dicarboxylate transporter DctA-like protein